MWQRVKTMTWLKTVVENESLTDFGWLTSIFRAIFHSLKENLSLNIQVFLNQTCQLLDKAKMHEKTTSQVISHFLRKIVWYKVFSQKIVVSR